MFSQAGDVTQCYIMCPVCTRTWVTSQAWKKKSSQKVTLHLSAILLISFSILRSLSHQYIFSYSIFKNILVSIAPLLLHLSILILCGVCMYICPFKCLCVHMSTCFFGPRLRSGIFLDHSFLSFFEAQSPSQTKTMPITLAFLLSLSRYSTLPSKAGVPGRPSCPPSVYISSGDLNAPSLTCFTAEQSTQPPHSPFKNISSLFGFSLSTFN